MQHVAEHGIGHPADIGVDERERESLASRRSWYRLIGCGETRGWSSRLLCEPTAASYQKTRGKR
jgi:hypothetical protein